MQCASFYFPPNSGTFSQDYEDAILGNSSHYLVPTDADMETLAQGDTDVKFRWNLNSASLALSPCS